LARKITVEEAEKLLAQKPSMRATFAGLIMGIFLALMAQLIFRPLEVKQQQLIDNFTIYIGNQPITKCSPLEYFGWVFGLFALGCVIYWSVQMRVVGLTGSTRQEVPHGVAKEDLESFVDKLDLSLAKGERYGYTLNKYPSEVGTFTRGIRLSANEKDSVSIEIRPLIAVVESEKNPLSLEAAKRAIDIISSRTPII